MGFNLQTKYNYHNTNLEGYLKMEYFDLLHILEISDIEKNYSFPKNEKSALLY